MSALRTEPLAMRRFAASREVVFGCLADIAAWSSWLPDAIAVRVLDPGPGPGARLRLGTEEADILLELLLDEPPASLIFSVIDEPERGVETWELTAAADGGCTVRVTLAVEDHDPNRRLLEFLIGALQGYRARVTLQLDALARLLGES